MPAVRIGEARLDLLVPGGRSDQHGQHPLQVDFRQPTAPLAAGVLAYGPVYDYRAGPVAQLIVEECGGSIIGMNGNGREAPVRSASASTS